MATYDGKFIDSGGLAKVYGINYPGSDLDLVAKVMHRHYQNDSTLWERFLHEANLNEILSNLNHKAFLKYGGFEEGVIINTKNRYGDIKSDNLRAALLLERFDFPSLNEVINNNNINNNTLSLEEAARLGVVLCDAVSYVHNCGIVHRDIKPANILFDKSSFEVKLIDFGLSGSKDRPLLDRGYVNIGSPDYMSPEMWHSIKMDKRSDLFALGLVLASSIMGKKIYRIGNYPVWKNLKFDSKVGKRKLLKSAKIQYDDLNQNGESANSDFNVNRDFLIGLLCDSEDLFGSLSEAEYNLWLVHDTDSAQKYLSRLAKKQLEPVAKRFGYRVPEIKFILDEEISFSPDLGYTKYKMGVDLALYRVSKKLEKDGDKGLIDILSKMLEFDVNERYQDGRSIASDLAKIAVGENPLLEQDEVIRKYL